MTGEVWRSQCGKMELRCGDWREVLADVTERDAVIADPPYSERTHSGQCTVRNDGAGLTPISYAAIDETLPLRDMAKLATPNGWTVFLSDSVLTEPWRLAAESLGRVGFAPVPCVLRGMTVRLSGDGPSSWAVYANVSRPKSLAKWGTLPGAYAGTPGERYHIGGKPIWLMRAIVRDYSRPGDLIVDPYAGGGATLLAAAIEGRRAIGAELDPETFKKAVRRLEAGYTPGLFGAA